MCFVIFFTTLVWNFLTGIRIQRDFIINVQRSSCKVPLFWQILMTLEFTRQIFEKCLYIKFHGTSSSGIRIVSCRRTDGRTDGHTDIYQEANWRFSQCCAAPKKGPAVWCKHLYTEMKWVTEAGNNLIYLCDLVFQNYMSEVLNTRARELWPLQGTSCSMGEENCSTFSCGRA
jgi:hypothetical protein